MDHPVFDVWNTNCSPMREAQAVPAVSRQSPAAFFQAAKVDMTAWLQGDIGA